MYFIHDGRLPWWAERANMLASCHEEVSAEMLPDIGVSDEAWAALKKRILLSGTNGSRNGGRC